MSTLWVLNLSNISKLVEHVVAKRFISHASSARLLPVERSAYRFHSLEIAILSVRNDLMHAVDASQVTPLILLDSSSASKTINHPILLSILHSRFYLSGNSLSWFDSYVTGRTVISYISSAVFHRDLFRDRWNIWRILKTSVTPLNSTRLVFTSVLMTLKYTTLSILTRSFSNCISDVELWCSSRCLQLNNNKKKTKNRAHLVSLTDKFEQNSQPRLVTVCWSGRHQAGCDHQDLAMLLDAKLTEKRRTAKKASSCYFQLRRLRQVRRRVDHDITAWLMIALITRLVYC